MATKESTLIKAILDYFKYSKRYKLFRCNSGVVQSLQSFNWIHMAPKGTPDILGFDLNTGYFIGIETKTLKGRLSPEQIAFKDILTKTEFGIYILARSLDDVFETLEPREPLPF